MEWQRTISRRSCPLQGCHKTFTATIALREHIKHEHERKYMLMQRSAVESIGINPDSYGIVCLICSLEIDEAVIDDIFYHALGHFIPKEEAECLKTSRNLFNRDWRYHWLFAIEQCWKYGQFDCPLHGYHQHSTAPELSDDLLAALLRMIPYDFSLMNWLANRWI
jgi:hypothetical protein